MDTAEDRLENVVRGMVAQLKGILGDEVRAAIDEALSSRGIAATSGAAAQVAAPKAAPRAAKAAPKAVRPVAKAQPGKRVRRTADEIEKVAMKIMDALNKTPGLTSEGIQQATGLPKAEIQKPLEGLRDSKHVKTKGERRAMKYYPR